MVLDQPLLGGGQTTGGFGAVALVVQAAITAGFYNTEIDLTTAKETDPSSVYNFYVGVALMMFVGFGYLMTFLKAYGLGAVGLTMYVTCLGVQFAVLVEAYMGKGRVAIDFLSLLNGNFAIAAVLISFGGVIGKVSPLQLTVMTLVELACYCANKVYFLRQYADDPLIADCGGTIIIHVFGAFFGLCAAKVLGPPSDGTLNASSYVSDLFSLVGTVFLWLFWPSFVAGALPSGDGQTTALVNTVLALLASTVASFGLAPLLAGRKIGTVPIQNATLAGGVAIGATANLVSPFAAVCVGGVAGLLSTWGFVVGPFFSDVDTCGIANLHFTPGLLGGVFSALLPLFVHGTGLNGANQAIGLAGTLVFAGVSGTVTGVILKGLDTPKVPFTDAVFWDCADDIAK